MSNSEDICIFSARDQVYKLVKKHRKLYTIYILMSTDIGNMMNYSDYSLTPQQFLEYQQTKQNSKLQEIWEDILERLSEDPELKKEAIKKGYDVIDNPDMEDDIIAQYKMIIVPNATEKLQKFFIEKLYPFVVCLKEEEDEEMFY